jgi:hypothetical protein
MAIDQDEYDSMWKALGEARFVIWFCPARKEHGRQRDENGWLRPTVEWVAGVAHCLHPDCGRKSTDEREETA